MVKKNVRKRQPWNKGLEVGQFPDHRRAANLTGEAGGKLARLRRAFSCPMAIKLRIFIGDLIVTAMQSRRIEVDVPTPRASEARARARRKPCFHIRAPAAG
jgi:hypothetical protein